MKKLIIDSLTKAYGKMPVLEDINLSYSSGKIHAVTGCNGAGKSTLLHCIGGYTHYRGHIKRDGIASIGLLSANPYIFPRITGSEFIDFCLSAKKREKDKHSLEQLNALFSLPLHQFADEYSTGMLKKLHLLALFLQKNDLLLLDEPFNGLDALSSAYVSELLLQEKNRDTLIFVSSHDINHLLKIADTATHIENGKAWMKTDALSDMEKEIQARAKRDVNAIFGIK